MADVPAPRYPDGSVLGAAIGNLFTNAQNSQLRGQAIDQNNILLGQQRVFKDGVPIGPDGSPDWAAAMQMWARAGGDIKSVESLEGLSQSARDRRDAMQPGILSGGAAGMAPAGTFTDTLKQTESGNRNVYSTVDPDVSGPNTRSQGYYQINVPTWRDFAPKAGVDVNQYPTPMSAPEDVQRRVAEVIPFARFGPRTRADLEKKFGFGEDQKNLTIGELSSRYGGGSRPGLPNSGVRVASADPGFAPQSGASTAPTAPPATLAGGAAIPRAGDGAPPGGTSGGPQIAQGGPSIASMLGRTAPPEVAANVARALGVSANDPLSPDQMQRAQKIVQSYIGRTGRGGQEPQQPQFPQELLPPGFSDPWSAIGAINKEIDKFSGNPRAKDRIKTLVDTRDAILKELGKNKFTTLTPEQVSKIPGIDPEYRGVVQRDSEGKLTFPNQPNSSVKIDMKAEGAAAADLAKAKVKDVTEAIEAGPDARKKLATLSQLADVWNNAGDSISTGPGAETVLKLKQLGRNLGIDVGDVAPSELVQKIGTQLAAVASKGLTSRPTQFDFQVFLANNPGLTLTAQGNKMLINLMQQQAKNELQLSALARKQKNGENWDEVVEEFDKTHPIMSPITGKPLDPNAVIAPGPSRAGSKSPQPAATKLSSAEAQESIANAKAAIARGIPREAVIQRLRQNGIDASGL